MLNRPQALNSLTLDMIRALGRALDEAAANPEVRLVALWGAGDKGFCAGGDVKALTRLVREQDFARAEAFFREEYAVDLFIHRCPKPVVVLADGITMGGGLGLAAGADPVIATERTRMAMPETRIGFFPDVGATGWLSAKCPPGYPEYLGLTGAEIRGADAVRLGLAIHLTDSARLAELKDALKNSPLGLDADKTKAVAQLRDYLGHFFVSHLPANPVLDEKVAMHFAGKASVQDIMASLEAGASREPFCRNALEALQQRSPTALVLTLQLIRQNRGRPLEEVFAAELRAASFMIRHPDYLEGIRARVIDKDDRPVWRPSALEEVRLFY
jgi:enoyl-CoA hydratase/carnithine racemase